MESEVQEAAKVPRSELDTAFDVSRSGRWMVVQSVPTAPRGYELWAPHGARVRNEWGGLQVAMELSKDR
jgi:hypothetical protein